MSESQWLKSSCTDRKRTMTAVKEKIECDQKPIRSVVRLVFACLDLQSVRKNVMVGCW